MKQLGLGLKLSTNRTRKRECLDEMERVVPWAALVQVVEPHYPRAKKRQARPAERIQASEQPAELRRPKAELKRVTEDRDILKKRPPRTLPSFPGEVRVHQGVGACVPGAPAVPRHGGASERLLRLAG